MSEHNHGFRYDPYRGIIAERALDKAKFDAAEGDDGGKEGNLENFDNLKEVNSVNAGMTSPEQEGEDGNENRSDVSVSPKQLTENVKGVTVKKVSAQESLVQSSEKNNKSQSQIGIDLLSEYFEDSEQFKNRDLATIQSQLTSQEYSNFVNLQANGRPSDRELNRFNLAKESAKNYLLSLYGRIPEEEEQKKFYSQLVSNLYGQFQEEYDIQDDIPKSDIYAIIDDFAKNGSVPGISSIVGYRAPTTELGRAIEKYYDETNIFGRFGDGFSYGLYKTASAGELWFALDSLNRKRELDAALPDLEKAYAKKVYELQVRVKRGNLHPDAYKLKLAVARNPILVNRKFAAEHHQSFIDNLSDTAEFQKLLEQSSRNPVLKAIEGAKTTEEKWQLFTMDPMGVIGQFLLENSYAFILSKGAEAAGGLAGGPAGAAAAGAAFEAAMEYSQVLKEKLLKKGADLNDPQSVQQVMLENGDEFRRDAMKAGLIKGYTSLLGSASGELVGSTDFVKNMGNSLVEEVTKSVSSDIVKYSVGEARNKPKPGQ